MNFPSDLLYTKAHEWISLDGDIMTVGITDHAQDALGDIVFFESPEVGQLVEAEEAFCVIESVKTVSDVYAPLAGEVYEVNEAVEENAELINSDPYGKGWLVKIRFDTGEDLGLLDADEYEEFLKNEG